jgi:predicted metal-dependent hydrolase
MPPPGRPPSNGPARDAGAAGAVTFVRNRRARRYILRVTADGRARVTIPRGGSLHEAAAFLRRQQPWLDDQRRRQRDAAERRSAHWTAGVPVWFRGERVALAAVEGDPRAWSLGREIVRASESTPMCHAVARHLRALAATELPARVNDLARGLGLPVARVVVRDQKSRWGSCSSRGTISLNWRLVQMPAHVADYVILHELMHVRQADHSPRFWRLVRGVCPWSDEARAWLRRFGRDLL